MFLFISIVSLVVVPLLINKTTEHYFDWVKPYLRESWCAVALAYVIYFLTTDTATQLLMSWRNRFGNAHPVLAYVIPAIGGAILAPAYWWLMGKVLPRKGGKSATSPPIGPQEDSFANPKWELISDVAFKNTSVKVDGKRFYGCSFDNVTFEFEGTGPTEMIRCQTNGNLAAETSHPVARAYSHLWELLNSFPGGQVRFSAVDKEGRQRPSSLKVTEILPPPPLTLAARTFEICKEMRLYLREVGPEPQYNGSGSTQDVAKWLSDVVRPSQERFHAGYMLRFHARLVAIRHELAEKGLRDGEIDSFLGADVHNDRMLRKMIEALIMLAAKLDD